MKAGWLELSIEAGAEAGLWGWSLAGDTGTENRSLLGSFYPDSEEKLERDSSFLQM